MPDTTLSRVFRPPILNRSIKVAVIVGTLLNLINQGDRIFVTGDPDLLKLVLTYLVPFCVSSYGAWSALKDKD
ncbi:nitrate/nitrite transporter NrtS [Coralliovum pocilloporae]|uniref:nitrate/nitrite transporter NrtS n=1 Tax=Coralliovum pocilloporae TaxID=3066369 RepID=UPI003306D53C